MKKISLILLLLFSFCLYAQEVAPSSESLQSSQPHEVIFSKDSLNSADTPPLVIHRAGLFDVYQYKLLDGTKLSDRELTKLLKNIPENKSLLIKKNIWSGIDYAFIAGFCASAAVTVYANHKTWEKMEYYGATSAFCCFLFATCSGMIAHSYRSAAVDNYNLSVMGIPLN